jgi:glucose/arabinose dehydrogenase
MPAAREGRAILAGLVLAGCIAPAAASNLPPGFQETAVITGRTLPTAVRFAPNGQVFVAEKSGLLFVYDGVDDPSPIQVVDLRASVHNYGDRGLLGLAIHPDYPNTPYVYVLYAHDTWPPGDPRFGDPTQPRWGTGLPSPSEADDCPTPVEGCVVYNRLSRIQVDPTTYTGTEQPMLEGNWCQQAGTHSAGDLVFGADGMLYVSAGEGANLGADFGQTGNPVNPCDDPPDGIGGPNTGTTAEGGSLRSQDALTPGDPQSFSGSVLRLDVSTQPPTAPPDNPLVGNAAADDDLLVAMGLRNPFRMVARPGTGEIWVGDVGYNRWEEMDRIVDPTAQVWNFGWPCYEGDASGVLSSANRNPAFDQQDLCQDLYAGAIPPGIAPVAPFWAFDHTNPITPNDACASGGYAITGMAFNTGTHYPAPYPGALFFADSSRQCIWAMFPDAAGLPDRANVAPFVSLSPGPPVDLQLGPDGRLHYVDVSGGRVFRIDWFPANQPPVAALLASPQSGPAPLLVQFDATASSDAEDGANLSFDWDLDGDGVFGDAGGPQPSRIYPQRQSLLVRVRVSDAQGAHDDASVVVSVGNSAPVVSLTDPAPDLSWSVGEFVAFAGSATDPEDGPLPPASLRWDLLLHHCDTPTDCHVHPVTTLPGVASGSFVAPDHEYPCHLELRLTATDLLPGDWLDPAWPVRRRLWIDNSSQTETLVDFPVLVTLDPSRIDYGATAPGGADLRFTDAAGTPLAHEVETWNPGATSRIWVKVPSITGGSATDSLWMYHGNPAALSAEDPAGVWSNGYAAVWHLGASLADSTANANQGVNQGSTAATGLLGEARHFDGATYVRALSTPSLELVDAFTLEAWVALDDPSQSGSPRILSKKNNFADIAGYELIVQPAGDAVRTLGSGTDYLVAAGVDLDGSWHHVAAAAQGGLGRIYVDGADRTTDPASLPLVAGTKPLSIGRRAGGGDYFRGRLDEVRISSVRRSGDWIRAQHLSMTDAFLTVGPPELQGLLQTTASRLIDPRTVVLDFETQPGGLPLTLGSESLVAPFQQTFIVGSTNAVGADPSHLLNGLLYTFASWSDGGAPTHDVVAPAAPATFTAVYAPAPACDDGLDNDGDGAVDWDGGGVAAPDPQCHGNPSRLEQRRCGLGAELALLAGALHAARAGRRRSRPRP